MSGLRAPGAGCCTPPRLADFLLKRVLPAGKCGASILGDLREEFREVTTRGGAFHARRWYWQQALGLTVRYVTYPTRTAEPATRRSPMLIDFSSDLRTATRMIARSPGTSALIVVTLALAIGASTIGFAFADLALFRGLPVDDAARVVSMFGADTHGANRRGLMSGPDFLDFRARTRTLTHLSAYRNGSAALIEGGQSRTLRVGWATADFFAAMGQPAIHGRAFAAGDDGAGAPLVALLSHRYWQDAMEGHTGALGRSMKIGPDAYTIVGVITPAMEWGNLALIDVWLPLRLQRRCRATNGNFASWRDCATDRAPTRPPPTSARCRTRLRLSIPIPIPAGECGWCRPPTWLVMMSSGR